MLNKIRNIAAIIITLSIAVPFGIKASEKNATLHHGADISNSSSDQYIADTDSFVDTDYNEATELLTLDDEALKELADLGIDLNERDSDELANHIIDYATRYLGRPYRHGAKGPSAFDCSGFTSYVFQQYGIKLSPSSRTQYTQGEKIETNQVQPGDLLFFGGRSGGKTVGHVALAVDVDDNGTITFIHASNSGGIRYDKYPDGGYYSKRYIGARRVIE